MQDRAHFEIRLNQFIIPCFIRRMIYCKQHLDGQCVRLSCGRCPSWVIPKTIIKMVQTVPLVGTKALGWEFDSVKLFMGTCPFKISRIICKRKVSYPSQGFLSSATWPVMPKKHYNGLINRFTLYFFAFCRRR